MAELELAPLSLARIVGSLSAPAAMAPVPHPEATLCAHTNMWTSGEDAPISSGGGDQQNGAAELKALEVTRLWNVTAIQTRESEHATAVRHPRPCTP